MMSCGVSLERLDISEPDILLTAAELKDKSSDISEPNTGQQTCEMNEELDLQTECSSTEKDLRKPHKKHGPRLQRDAECGADCTRAGCSCHVATSAANLRLTLKKVKTENDDTEDDACVYVCHTKKPDTSKKLSVKCSDRSSNSVNKITSGDDDGMTDSVKVTLVLCMFNAV